VASVAEQPQLFGCRAGLLARVSGRCQRARQGERVYSVGRVAHRMSRVSVSSLCRMCMISTWGQRGGGGGGLSWLFWWQARRLQSTAQLLPHPQQ
jgi:hypothetical protein